MPHILSRKVMNVNIHYSAKIEKDIYGEDDLVIITSINDRKFIETHFPLLKYKKKGTDFNYDRLIDDIAKELDITLVDDRYEFNTKIREYIKKYYSSMYMYDKLEEYHKAYYNEEDTSKNIFVIDASDRYTSSLNKKDTPLIIKLLPYSDNSLRYICLKVSFEDEVWDQQIQIAIVKGNCDLYEVAFEIMHRVESLYQYDYCVKLHIDLVKEIVESLEKFYDEGLFPSLHYIKKIAEEN